MTLKQGQRTHTIKKKIYLVHSVEIKNENHNECLIQVKSNDMKEFLKNDTPGKPIYFAFAVDFLCVHPIPDKDYQCRLLGSVMFVQ